MADSKLEPIPPIFAWEPADLTAFHTVSQAEDYLEPADILAGTYAGIYDAVGRRLRALIVSGSSRVRLLLVRVTVPKEHVELKVDLEIPGSEGELKEILRESLSRRMDPQTLQQMELADLVALAVRYFSTEHP